MRASFVIASLFVLAGCTPPAPETDGGVNPNADAAPSPDTGVDAGPVPDAFVVGDGGSTCATPAECAAENEQRASDAMDSLTSEPRALADFLRAMPKGGDLHNHLTGAVYAETYLEFARTDGDCINTSSFAAVGTCGTGTSPIPTSGMPLFDQVVHAWSMEGFVPGGAESGHDHFFATFGKYGLVAGAHRDDDLADIATRAASENQVYIETMFNLGSRLGALAATVSTGTVTAADLPTLFDQIHADPGFASALATDVGTVRGAMTSYRSVLGCSGASPPAACDVHVRFIAQVARTGGNDQIFGQLIAAFEMAAMTPEIVGANLSSPEDDTRSINNYALHMAMLDFLHTHYTTTGASPLHVTLHAGELTPAFLPTGSTANTFHIHDAVEIGHAERIGHGIDILSETMSTELLDEMASRGVLVEVCLSSNAQILEVSGTAHPLAQYLAHGVPVALATDDQGVSRSSLAGEYLRAVLDQHLDYRQLKAMARASLEHSFLPGASLFTSLTPPTMVAACDAVSTPPSASCQTYLDANERASAQYELEQNFLTFESAQ